MQIFCLNSLRRTTDLLCSMAMMLATLLTLTATMFSAELQRPTGAGLSQTELGIEPNNEPTCL